MIIDILDASVNQSLIQQSSTLLVRRSFARFMNEILCLPLNLVFLLLRSVFFIARREAVAIWTLPPSLMWVENSEES